MDVWLVRDGKTSGPFPDYEVRRQIIDRTLTAEVHAWHDGLKAWKPLAEIELFRSEFEQPTPRAEITASVPPPLPTKPRLIRRFLARWFDLSLYSSIWWAAMLLSGRDISAVFSNLWIMLPHFVPWFVLESFLLHYFKCTPGKWLLGLGISNLDGSALSLTQSSYRSARVFFSGIGFGWELLMLLCQVLSFFTTKHLGRTLWDQIGGHQLTAATLRPARIILFVVLFLGSITSQLFTVTPYVLSAAAANSPEIKAELEKNPLWHLIKRP